MSYSFRKDLNDLRNFELYIENLLNSLVSNSNNSNQPISLSGTSVNAETNVIDLQFLSNLTVEQYALLEQAITSYVEPPSDEILYRTRPCVFPQTSVKNNTFTTINSLLYSGTYHTDELVKLRVNSRLVNNTNLATSNHYYHLRVVDITNNLILGSNILNNSEYEYNTIPLSNVSSQTATLELQGMNISNATRFDINAAQLVYLFK